MVENKSDFSSFQFLIKSLIFNFSPAFPFFTMKIKEKLDNVLQFFNGNDLIVVLFIFDFIEQNNLFLSFCFHSMNIV